DERPQSNPRRAPEIDVTDGFVTEHPAKHQGRIELREPAAGLVDLEDVAEAALPELEPLRGAVFVKLLGLHREAVGGEPAKEDAVKALPDVFVDDPFDSIQARLRGGHQGADLVWSEAFFDASDARHREFVTVLAATRSILVVKVARPIQRCTEMN